MTKLFTAGGLRVDVDTAQNALTIFDEATSERLLIVPSLHLCLPEFDGVVPDLSLAAIKHDTNQLRIVFTSTFCHVAVQIAPQRDCLTLSSEIVVQQDCELTRLSILPTGSDLNLYEVVNFRNRHYTARTWPELLLGGSGCSTDTYSRDWQFAPHPSMLVFQKEETALCLGTLDLPTSYGLYFAASDFHLDHCYLDYGSSGQGQKLTAGSVFSSPIFCLFLHRSHDPYETVQRYTQILIDEEYIPTPTKKVRYAWHKEPLYCSWMDQGYIGGHTTPDELGLQQLTGSNPTVEACTETLIRNILDTIEKQRLPFRTILIDDGWQITRGQWEPDTKRFPDLRALVDEIHARGMKAIVWWNWAEIFDDAVVDVAHLAGQGWTNRHGRRMRDYSHPSTQRDYLEPLFYKLLSSDPGCYDLDGIKTDFLADKIHPDTPLYDPAWRGEENYFYRLFQLFYSLMRRAKPDACHIGCAGHPYLAEYIDINRTYDVATSHVQEHANRARMLACTTPGCPVAFDLHNYVERFAEYFQVAKEIDAGVQIGNILGMKQDRFSEWEPADEAFYEIIRRGIS